MRSLLSTLLCTVTLALPGKADAFDTSQWQVLDFEACIDADCATQTPSIQTSVSLRPTEFDLGGVFRSGQKMGMYKYYEEVDYLELEIEWSQDDSYRSVLLVTGPRDGNGCYTGEMYECTLYGFFCLSNEQPPSTHLGQWRGCIR